MRFPPLFNLFCGALCIGFAPIFVKLITLPPTLIGVYRCVIAGIVLLALSWRIEILGKPQRRWVWISGFVFALDLYIWHRSVVLAGAGLGTILGNTQVFYTSLFGLIFLKETLKLRFWFAVVLAFVGIYLLVGFRAGPATDLYWLGVVYGVVTGVVYALYLLCIRQAERHSGLSSPRLLAEVSLICAFFLFIASVGEGTLQLPHGIEWTWLIVLAIVAQVTGWWLITHHLPKVPISQAGLVLLTQPVVATILGACLFSEALGFAQLCGASATLFAIYLGATGRQASIKLLPTQTDK